MSDYSTHADFQNLQLGESTTYPTSYKPTLLQAVPRLINRDQLNISSPLPFTGEDIWHAYEVSWLNMKGKPCVALARFRVPASSPNIIESKSFKLYLNSVNQTRFDSEKALVKTFIKDLSATAGATVSVELFAPDNNQAFAFTTLPGSCIDELDIEVDNFDFNADLLRLNNKPETVDESLHSHLLKSNCLITSQPDWASVVISYKGPQINREALLRYIISFRQHNEFHEQCVERIFCDIQQRCKPLSLRVYALYTRRGGLDINPVRCSDACSDITPLRCNRQ